MQTLLNHITSTLLLFLISLNLFSQVNTEGTVFWAAFMHSTFSAQHNQVFYISSQNGASGTVEALGVGFNQPFVVPAGGFISVTVPQSLQQSSYDVIENLGIKICADDTISVVALSDKAFDTDATIILPKTSLGTEYYTMNSESDSIQNSNFQYPPFSEFQILAVEDNTIIEVTKTQATKQGSPAWTNTPSANPPNIPYLITLNKGETYQVGYGDDLIGSHVLSTNNKNFAVFSGSRAAYVDNQGAADLLWTQNYPVKDWGTHFISTPIKTHDAATVPLKPWDRYRVLAKDNGTTVIVDGVNVATLNSGEYYQYEAEFSTEVITNKPVAFALLGLGKKSITPIYDQSGDPWMTMIPPVNAGMSKTTFSAFTTFGITQYFYLNITTKTVNVGNMRLNGAPVFGSTVVPNNPTYSYFQITLTPNTTYTVESLTNDKFHGMVYGLGGENSYGYFLGSTNPALKDTLTIDVPDTLFCSSTPETYSTPDTSDFYNFYTWNFGDGSPIDSGSTVLHALPGSGTYIITLHAYYDMGCSFAFDIITDTVVVIGSTPVAIFSYLSDCSTSSFSFNDNSIVTAGNIISWNWNFGDGNTSSQQNPSHTYGNAGSYSVTLIVESNFGCIDTVILPASYNNNSFANFSANNVCEGLPVNFINQTTIGTSTPNFSWDFETDGIIDNNIQHPVFTYPNPGNYNATLIVIDTSGCTDTITKQITINPLPNVGFTFTTACIGSTTQFTDTTGNASTWNWNFNNGNIANTATPTTVYNNAGNYNINLIVVSDSGCTDSTQATIIIDNNPIAAFSFTEACPNSNTTFTDNSTGPNPITGWNWTFSNGSSTLQNPTNIYTIGGISNVFLEVVDTNGCTDTISQFVNIPFDPAANFLADSICEGELVGFTDASTIPSGNITTWNWTFGDGNTANSQNPTNYYSTNGQYNVTLTTTSNHGCTNTITKPISVWENPIANFTNTAGCANSIIQFTDLSSSNNGSISNWNWLINGNTYTTQQPNTAFPNGGIQLSTLVVTSSHGCKDTINQQVTIYESPKINFTADTLSGCNLVCVNFTDNTSSLDAINTWNWNFGNGDTSKIQNPNHCFINETNLPISFDISLTVTTINGCSNDSTANGIISVYPIPVADFTYNPSALDEYNTNVFFNDQSYNNITSWNWNFGDGANSSNQNPSHNFGQAGEFDVFLSVTNIWECSNSTTQLIEIKPIASLYVPNAFTPDGDGLNDAFLAVGRNMAEFDLMIFDRWGEMIFSSNNINNGWNGTYKGELVKNDVYVWKIKAEDVLGENYNLVGHVTLVK